MTIGSEFAGLFRRDLTRLKNEIEAFPEELLWTVVPGVTNPAGNLALHLEGNLREYIGRILCGVAYQRSRPDEFGKKGVGHADLVSRAGELLELIPPLLERVEDARWAETYPEVVLGMPLTNHQFVVHLHGHFNYHVGQMDYLRRVLTGDGAIKGVTL